VEPTELSKIEVMRKLQTRSARLPSSRQRSGIRGTMPVRRASTQGDPGKPELTAAPTTIPEDATFQGLKLVTKSAYVARYRELSKSMDVDLTAQTFDGAKILLKTGYLQWAVKLESRHGGNCTYLAGVTIGFLSDNSKLVPEGATVEQFNCYAWRGACLRGDRTRPAEHAAILATWATSASSWTSVRTAARHIARHLRGEGLTEGSPFYDPAFLKFIREGGTISRGPAFSYLETDQLR